MVIQKGKMKSNLNKTEKQQNSSCVFISNVVEKLYVLFDFLSKMRQVNNVTAF